MPKITSVEPQKKNLPAGRQVPRRFNIFLDGIFAFGADEDLVVEHRLIVGKVIDSQDLERLLFEAEVGKLMERMYQLFNIRQRSEKEVKDYLKNLSFKRKVKGFDEISDIAIDLLIEKLKQKRLLNDEDFAKAWVESRSKKKGIRALKAELFKKGIDRETIERVTETEDLGVRQQVTAKQLLLKRLPRFKNLPFLEKKKKSYDFLLRRGFDYEIVSGIVEKMIKKE